MATTPTIEASKSELSDRDLFPVLTPEQLRRATRFGNPRSCGPGEVLLAPGARVVSIFVVVGGQVEIVRIACEEESIVASLGPGQFTGELSTLAGQPAMVCIRAAAQSDVIEIGRDQILRIVQADSELSDLLMRAFLLRRVAIIARHLGDSHS